MTELIKIFWRDIPSQVTARAGRKSARVMLPERFQQAIDRAAMRAGKGSSDAYLEDWRRERGPCDGDLQTAAERTAAALEDMWNEEKLEALVKVKGVAADLGKSRAQLAAEASGRADVVTDSKNTQD